MNKNIGKRAKYKIKKCPYKGYLIYKKSLIGWKFLDHFSEYTVASQYIRDLEEPPIYFNEGGGMF